MLTPWIKAAQPVLAACALSLVTVGTLGMTGCASPLALSPDYTPPEADRLLPAAQWQAALPHEGRSQNLLDWWKTFNDPVLDTLLARAEKDSPTLAEAAARINEARSHLETTESHHWPTLSLNAHALRNNGSADIPTPAMTTRGTTLDARWEIDLFGHTHQGTERAASARLSGSEQGWHAARISLAAEVADHYVRYRACERLLGIDQAEQTSRQQSRATIERAVQEGLLSTTDLQQARASEAMAISQAKNSAALCALLRKSLVTLTGEPESSLQVLLDSTHAKAIPEPAAFSVDTLPVALLSQRPDLAAAERELAATHAEIGAAHADRFPRLSLVGSLTRDKTRADDGPTYISSPWFFGPALSLPLFNGGALAAREEAAQARHTQALARYRQAVRLAIEEAEGALVNLDAAQTTQTQSRVIALAWQGQLDSAEKQFQAGSISRLALEESRRLAQNAQRQTLISQRELVRRWIGLYKALGGGWSASSSGAVLATAVHPSHPPSSVSASSAGASQ